jgi:SanA protein
LLCLLLLGLALASYYWVQAQAEPYLYRQIEQVPYTRIALLPGTTPLLRSGKPNPYFQYRIQAAAALFRAGKIGRILVSGDNQTRYYNEPRAMRKALVQAGVPPDSIVLDKAGLRTLDSVLRSHQVFGHRRVLFISQGWHAARALYIGRAHGLHTWGFAAQNPADHWQRSTCYREYLARVRMLLDVHLLGTRPTYTGHPDGLAR